MGNVPNPPPQGQHFPEPPDQEDPQMEDPQGDDLLPEDNSLPQTEEEDFPSDVSPAGSEDSDGSFKTVEQTPSPKPPVPKGHSPHTFSLRRDPLADPNVSTPFHPPVASTPMVPSHTGTIPKTRQLDTQIGPGASTSAGNTPRLPRQNIRGMVSAENTPRPATRAQHKRMGTVVDNPSYKSGQSGA